MTLNLSEMLKKAEAKIKTDNNPPVVREAFRPWQQQSVLFNVKTSDNYSDNKSDNSGNNSGINTDNTDGRSDIFSGNSDIELGISSDNKTHLLGNKLDNSLGNKLGNKSQWASFDFSIPDIKFHVSNLYGIQKKLFIYFLEASLPNDNFITGPINTKKLSIDVGCSYGTTKTIINRLIKKGVIKRLKGKSSQAGYINFLIEKNVREIALESLKKQSGTHFKENYLDIELGNRTSINSDNKDHTSSSFIKETTTEMIEGTINFEWLKNIDIEPLSEIGFSTHHLSQLVSQEKLSAEVIQESINSFAFDLKENNKAKSIKGLPLNFFMGILRKGMPYTPPPNYETPEVRKMREFLERKKEIEKKAKEVEEEALKMAFNEWLEPLSEEEKDSFTSDDAKKSGLRSYRTASLMTYFKENLWISKKAEFFAKG